MEKKNSIAEIARRNRSIPITEPSNRGRVLIHAHRTVAKEEGGRGKREREVLFPRLLPDKKLLCALPFSSRSANWRELVHTVSH